MRLLIPTLLLASHETQKIFVRRSLDVISSGVQIWTARWPLFLLNHLQTVHVQALLSNMCCVHRASCISLNLPLCPAAVGCSLQWNLEA